MIDAGIFSTFIFMKRIVAPFLFLVMAALTLCGCGDDSSSVIVRVIPAEHESSSSVKLSSSSAQVSSSSERYSSSIKVESSSSAKSSSSNEEISSSGEFVLDTGEFVKIGEQEWMTRNLNIPVEGSRCYDNEPANCEKYGRMYTWSLAMAIDTKFDREELGFLITPYRGICPEGSHLPTDDEWQELYEYIEEHPEYKAYFTNQIGGAYDWRYFYRDEDVETVFWTATEYDATGSGFQFEYAWIWAYRKDGSIARNNPHKYMGAYVRCLKGGGVVFLNYSDDSDN